MFPSPLVGFGVEPLDVGIELFAIDAPDPSSAYLHGRQLSRADQRVDLGNADVQIRRHVLECKKSRLDAGRPPTLVDFMRIGHGHTLATPARHFIGLGSFTAV